MTTEEQLKKAYARLCELNPTAHKSVSVYISSAFPTEVSYLACIGETLETGKSVADAIGNLEAKRVEGLAEERRRAKERCEALGMTVSGYAGEF